MDKASTALLAVAADVEAGLPLKSLWSDLHRRSYEQEPWPCPTLTDVFDRLQTAADVRHREYLSPVLKKADREQIVLWLKEAAL